MPTVTISRQMGSTGHSVAKMAAEILGYRLVWREVINQAAHISGSPEAALAAIDELGMLSMCPSPKKCKAYRKAVEKVMHELAEEGNVVILGRAGQVILSRRPDVLHVRIIAPAELRAQRVAQIHAITYEYALEQIHASDKHRETYVDRFYQQRWDDPDLYDLVLNTARLAPETAAEMIAAAVRAHE
jgi:cytidylate kinase